MKDPRLAKWANVLVNYSNEIKPGDWAVVQGPVVALPLMEEVGRAILRAGGHYEMRLNTGLQEMFYKEANDEQLAWISPSAKISMEQCDALFSIWGTDNTRSLSNIDPAIMAKAQGAQRELFTTMLKRMADKSLTWVGTQYPTNAHAQEAEMSLDDYTEFSLNAMLLNEDDPVAAWQAVRSKQQAKVDWLKGKKRVAVKSANCDLTLSIEDRLFDNASGKENMPDGEIYTSPVEDSVNGWVRYSFPAIYHGRSVEGVELKFENGKVVDAKAEKNEAFLKSQLELDEGASYLGEFAIGTNFGIKNFTGEILFDEKIGGTIHLAIGSGFPELGGKNESAVHWDMICDMRDGGEIYVDDELFYKDGDFVV